MVQKKIKQEIEPRRRGKYAKRQLCEQISSQTEGQKSDKRS
jgi:hypothetical protein